MNKIEQVKHVKRYFKTKMCQDVPRCAKMCQDVPRCAKTATVLPSQLFELRVSPRERETLQTSHKLFFTAAVAVPDFCFLMFPSFLDVPSFHWLCSLASSLSAWAFTTLSAQKSEREHREHAAFLPRKHCKSLGFLFKKNVSRHIKPFQTLVEGIGTAEEAWRNWYVCSSTNSRLGFFSLGIFPHLCEGLLWPSCPIFAVKVVERPGHDGHVMTVMIHPGRLHIMRCFTCVISNMA